MPGDMLHSPPQPCRRKTIGGARKSAQGSSRLIPFPGGAQVVSAVESGKAAAGISGYSEFSEQIASGKLRAIGVSSRTSFMGVPSVRQQGVDADLANWRGVFTGKAVPAPRQAVPVRGTGAFQTILRPDDQQQTVVGVCSAPPLETEDRYAAHLLATILGDHTGSRLYWTLIDPGHADGAELSYQDYNQAGALFTFLSCSPEETQANLERIAEVFVGAGLAADTPVAIIASATYAAERLLETQLGRAGHDAKRDGIGAPAIVVVGGIASKRRDLLPSLLRESA